jgi:hypothetical protein
VFSASAGYGLLKMLVVGMSNGADVGIAEFSTHSGLTLVFFVLAALGAYGAKKCVAGVRMRGTSIGVRAL